ncbi:MAG: hypothetical protein VYD87_14840 [Pseudomonadota bacterium]|nr:hypothetical protein [Pseudomonadota bacterium]
MRFLRLVDRLSHLAAWAGAGVLATLVAMLAAEAARRLLSGAETPGAFDLGWMGAGAVLALGLGRAVRSGRLAGLRSPLPARLAGRARGGVELCLVAPLLGGAAAVGAGRALSAFRFDGVLQVSDWEPVLWPFLALLAAGLGLLAVQVAADGLRRLAGRPETRPEGRA